MLDQEERLLKQSLEQLTRQSTNNIRLITREQQVITAKLKLLEQRLTASRQRTLQAMEREERKKERATTSGKRSLTLSPGKEHIARHQQHSRGEIRTYRYYESFFPATK